MTPDMPLLPSSMRRNRLSMGIKLKELKKRRKNSA
jgi:hypothetical protein